MTTQDKTRAAFKAVRHALNIACIKAENTTSVEVTYIPAIRALNDLWQACEAQQESNNGDVAKLVNAPTVATEPEHVGSTPTIPTTDANAKPPREVITFIATPPRCRDYDEIEQEKISEGLREDWEAERLQTSAATHALRGYLESLKPGQPVTQGYVDRLWNHYMPQLMEGVRTKMKSLSSDHADRYTSFVPATTPAPSTESSNGRTPDFESGNAGSSPASVSTATEAWRPPMFPQMEDIAKHIHYPQCWDTVNYPTIYDALYEVAGCVRCSECEQGIKPKADQLPTPPEASKEGK
jgi:hypothetical protein